MTREQWPSYRGGEQLAGVMGFAGLPPAELAAAVTVTMTALGLAIELEGQMRGVAESQIRQEAMVLARQFGAGVELAEEAWRPASCDTASPIGGAGGNIGTVMNAIPVVLCGIAAVWLWLGAARSIHSSPWDKESSRLLLIAATANSFLCCVMASVLGCLSLLLVLDRSPVSPTGLATVTLLALLPARAVWSFIPPPE